MKLIFPALCATLLLMGCERPISLSGQILIVTKRQENLKPALVPVRLYSADDFEMARKLAEERVKEKTAIASKALADSKRWLPYSEGPWLHVEETRWERDKLVVYLAQTDAHTEDEIAKANERLQRFRDIITILEERNHSYEVEVARAVKEEETASIQLQKAASLNDAIIETLPAPLSETRTDGDGKYQMKVKKPGNYVIVAAASPAVPNGNQLYFWFVPTKLTKTPVTVLLSNDNLSP